MSCGEIVWDYTTDHPDIKKPKKRKNKTPIWIISNLKRYGNCFVGNSINEVDLKELKKYHNLDVNVVHGIYGIRLEVK